MCYASPDPKYAMRDIEARVAFVAREQDKTKQAAGAPRSGLIALMRDAVNGLLRKDRAHV